MQCDEGSLRDVFRSPLGPAMPELLLDAVEGGVVVEVLCGDKVQRIADRDAALALLAEKFRWAPAGIVRTHAQAAHSHRAEPHAGPPQLPKQDQPERIEPGENRAIGEEKPAAEGAHADDALMTEQNEVMIGSYRSPY